VKPFWRKITDGYVNMYANPLILLVSRSGSEPETY
jgi:hypothetical protein